MNIFLLSICFKSCFIIALLLYFIYCIIMKIKAENCGRLHDIPVSRDQRKFQPYRKLIKVYQRRCIISHENMKIHTNNEQVLAKVAYKI